MTTVVALQNMPSTPTDVAVKFLDQTKLEFRTQTISPDRLIQTAEYIYADGSLAYETVVSLRVAFDPKSGINRYSVRLSTIQTVTVDDVLTDEEPTEVIISWNVKGYVRDVDALMSMIGTAFSVVFNGVTTKVPNTGTLMSISRGLIHGLFG